MRDWMRRMTARRSEPAIVVRLPWNVSAGWPAAEGGDSRRYEDRKLRYSARSQDLLGERGDPVASERHFESGSIKLRTYQTALAETITTNPKKPAVRIDTFLRVLLKTSLAVGLLFLKSFNDLRKARI